MNRKCNECEYNRFGVCKKKESCEKTNHYNFKLEATRLGFMRFKNELEVNDLNNMELAEIMIKALLKLGRERGNEFLECYLILMNEILND